MKPMHTEPDQRRVKTAWRSRWLAGLLGIALVYWWVMADGVVTNFWDPQYAVRYDLLRENLAQRPGRPLWLVLGTSHVDNGLRPGVLSAEVREGKGPLLFNFGLGGADVFREMVCLNRLLKAGIKPQKLVLEVNSALMTDVSYFLVQPEMIVRSRADELGEYAGMSRRPWRMKACWIYSRLSPFCPYGMAMKGQTLPWRLVPWPGIRKYEFNLHDEWGWNSDNEKPREVEKYYARIQEAYAKNPGNYTTFHLSEQSAEIMRKIIGTCRENGIELVFLRMPMSVDYAALYTPEAVEQLRVALERIETENGIREIDARDWVEAEGFSDGRHMTGMGAEKFTRRFVEVLSGVK